MVGCEKPLDLSLHRSRIFLLGRLLSGQTCDVRLIWRAGANDPVPVTVTADLSEIGGDAAQELTADNQSIWRWTGQVAPPAFGEKTLRITALDADDEEYPSEKQVQVHNAAAKAVAIDCGAAQSLALKADGTVVDWQVGTAGSYVKCDQNQEAFYASEGLDNVVAIAAGYYHNLALKADGTVAAWGNSGDDSFDVPDNLTDIVALAAASIYNLALKADGTVAAWGDNDSLGLNIPHGLTDVVALAAGNACAHALKADGTVASWLAVRTEDLWAYPDDYCDVPEGLENVVSIEAWENTLALTANGSAVMWGGRGDSLPRRAGDFRAKAVAAGYSHWMALREDGTVMLWWRSTQYAGLYYVSHERLENIIAIADGLCGFTPPNSMALTSDGSVLAWEEWWDGQHELTVPEELQ